VATYGTIFVRITHDLMIRMEFGFVVGIIERL
jgi:hypothetical protein